MKGRATDVACTLSSQLLDWMLQCLGCYSREAKQLSCIIVRQEERVE
jgi:hypothetical protein